MIDQTLANLGFSPKECAIYLALLQHGKMTPAELAKLTRISRPTVYSVAKELIKKGVLLEDLGEKSRMLIAKQPDDLVVLTNREQKELEEKKRAVDRAIQELKTVAQSNKYAIPKIVFIPEEEVNDYFYKQTAKWHQSIMADDGCWWGFQDHTLVEEYKDYIDWHWTKISPPKMVLRLLSNESKIEDKMKTNPYPNRHIRFWQSQGEFTASTWVCGDYVIMAVTNQHPHYLVEIHDATFAANLRLVFKGIWASLDKQNS